MNIDEQENLMEYEQINNQYKIMNLNKINQLMSNLNYLTKIFSFQNQF